MKGLKIKKMLVSQPAPLSEKSPYADFSEKYHIEVEFRKFIEVEKLDVKEIRKQRIDVLAHTAVIFTSKTGIDSYFKTCEEMRIIVPETMKYFCVSETIAHYLQMYIVYRKRKIFFGGTGTFKGLMDILPKHAKEKFLLVLPEVYSDDMLQMLDQGKYKYTKGVFYKTVDSDVSDLNIDSFDIIAFFSPQGIKSLFTNFPDFQQKNKLVATFGVATAKAAEEANLTVNIPAPTKEALSMLAAIELYIKENS